MSIIFTFCTAAALVSGLLAFGFNIYRGGRAFISGISAAIAAAVIEFLSLYFIMPGFAHWTSGGYIVTGLNVLVCAIASSYIFSFDEYKDNSATGSHSLVGFAVFVAIAFIAGSCSASPWDVVDNGFWDQVAALTPVREATAEELSLAATDDDLLKITPAQAHLDAQGEMPGDIGSYSAVGTTFEQTVNGVQVYITDLKVTNDRGFRSNGAALPGFFMRPAKDIGAETTFVAGFSMRYVPDAWFQFDLNRHVYLNYTLSCSCQVDNLDVLELDDEGNPKYTGTVWEYVQGNVGMRPRAVIVVDPQTGVITEYGMNEVPEWIDRIYSLERATKLVQYWAKYSEWNAELVENLSGKMQVDAAEDVYGHDGLLEYMITVTSAGSDQTLKYDMRFDPRTGEILKFNATGKTLQAVDDLIDEQTYTEEINTALGAEPVECERQVLLGEWTYYCVLQSKGEGEGSVGAIVGYAFLQERFTSSPNMVVVANNFRDAWNEFRLQVTTGVGDAQVQGEASDTIVFIGEVLYKGDRAIDGMVWLVVKNDKYPEGLYFRVSEKNPVVSLTQVGHKVEIVAFDLRVDQVNDVVSITNLDLPPITPAP